MKLVESQIATIVYEKEQGETSARVIIPTSVPKDVVRAIDVSELDSQQRAELAEKYAEYKQYVATVMKTMFTFETWMSHTHNVYIEPKWRTFKVSGMR